ncbi:MAG: DegT/DnrJ/EryC1/StrS family aminotransferase [Ignavibacteria bacterium]|jgi:dTDP-4-amino-4,6-dideoxygalactose transaminase
MKVPLLDLKPQYKSLKNELDDKIIEISESQYFILGPEVQAFETEISEFLNAKYAIGVSSGTDALLLTLMGLDIQPGDEIILPTYSFFATAGVVSRMNAAPVFVDSDPITFNIDPDLIEEKITDKTKAIIVVHLYGQSTEMDKIMAIAKEHNLKVVEDAAQAISVQYKDGKCVGTIGDVGCYSFFPSKNLGCFGDGGLIVTNDEQLEDMMRIKRVHGGKPKYYHSVIGGNFRLDALQAGVLRVKLPHLNKWSEERRKNADLYNKLFIENNLAEETGKVEFGSNNKVLLPKAVYENTGHKNYHIYNQYIIRVEKRNELKDFLKENEIFTEIYYPVPFHKQKCFESIPSSSDKYPVAEFAADHSLALPIYPELSDKQIEYVVKKIKEFIHN